MIDKSPAAALAAAAKDAEGSIREHLAAAARHEHARAAFAIVRGLRPADRAEFVRASIRGTGQAAAIVLCDLPFMSGLTEAEHATLMAEFRAARFPAEVATIAAHAEAVAAE